jgi:PST family polysaccharide transporter
MAVGKKALSGATSMLVRTGVQSTLSFLFSIVLLRLLTQNDYGVYYLAVVLYGFASRLREFGLNSIFIQNPEFSDALFSTHLIAQGLLSLASLILLFLFFLLAGFIPALAVFYRNNPDIIYVAIVLAAIYVFDSGGLSSTPISYLEKNIEYKRYAIIFFAAFMTSNVAGITSAYLGFKFWSLVVLEAVRVGTIFVLGWTYCPVKPRFNFDREIFKRFFAKGKHLWLNLTAGYVMFSLDSYLVGMFAGESKLGYYGKSAEASRLPYGFIGSVLQVAFPVYSKFQNDKEKLSRTYSLILSFLARVSFSFAFLLFIIIPELTELAYSAKWLPVVPIFRLMILYALLRPLYDTTGGIMIAVGKEKVLSRIGLSLVLIMIICITPMVYFEGVNGAALGIGVMMLFGFIIQAFRLRETVTVNYTNVFAAPMLALIVATVCSLGLPEVFHTVLNSVSRFFVPAASRILDLFRFIKVFDVQRICYLFVLLFTKAVVFALVYGGLLIMLERGKLLRQGRFLYDTFRGKPAGDSPSLS